MQVPFVQKPLVQTLPQLPQFCGSVSRFLQIPLQSVSPVGQAQVPFWHVFPPVHTCPQLPQFCGSVSRFLHTPLQHNPVEQMVPHAPQLFGSDDISVQVSAQHSFAGQHRLVNSQSP
jgi:hypothetical protein